MEFTFIKSVEAFLRKIQNPKRITLCSDRTGRILSQLSRPVSGLTDTPDKLTVTVYHNDPGIHHIDNEYMLSIAFDLINSGDESILVGLVLKVKGLEIDPMLIFGEKKPE
ncbi:MAG: hypothetical protein QNK37_13415 [Acidobacteriota bacterium]|nr:hypothetical protein [Acidobacteriota bacterium]